MLLAERGELPVAEAVDYVLQALDALAEAHRKGLVHRDLKPANLFLTTKNDGSPLLKVLDFGIVKTSPGEGETAITGGDTVGSPMYMSPEQIREARSVDARADIWSLGVILYELLAGHPPFLADTVGGVFAKIFSDEIKPINKCRPDTPMALAGVIHGCLAFNRDQRIADVASLASLLAPFASERGKLVAQAVAEVYSTSERAPSDPSQRASTTGKLQPRSSDEFALTQTAVSEAHTPLPSGPIAPEASPSDPGVTRAPPRSAAPFVAVALVAALGLGAFSLRPEPGQPASSPGVSAASAPIAPVVSTATSASASASPEPPASQAPSASAALSAAADASGRSKGAGGAPSRPTKRGRLDLDRRD